MNMNLRILRVISPVAFLIIGFLLGQDLIALPYNLSANNIIENISVTLVVDYSDGRVDTYNNVRVLPNRPTVLDVLAAVAKENDLPLVIDYSKRSSGYYGSPIISIDGASRSDDGHYWDYKINNEKPYDSVVDIELRSGDTIFLVYSRSIQPPDQFE
ncbi:MAG: hypothetical protein COT81_01160 [Candidatus Buchananbacteria bacterium CG10_big_fil_rev_8_21_14_0_10_42_9]|uniref:Transcobalamin-like C-terminal domain-containing protein n=1 Tax=Candidatus Buchananbacteria bacterium CG10_big_fil_rev_8_21_14_0_10_42_9 TaxID=1974526 RepID=A0A2H0W1Y0_9BACT|nr:MAG: hypothetical protein COT81_01160 [Candidatus Buchananbacteria bacterium CG10_big_fil_rev_8_21_14_0_10_42_9]